MKKYFKYVVGIICLILFIILSIFIYNKSVINIDNYFYKFISIFINKDLTNIIKILTYIGSAIAVISITIITLILFKNKKYGIYLGIDLITITIIQVILKNIFKRSRPIGIALIKQDGYSFPSGHSLTTMAFYGLIIYFIYRSKLSKKSKIIFISLFTLFILVTGLSRIYLGVHYLTDVLGGFLLGIIYLIIYTSLIKL